MFLFVCTLDNSGKVTTIKLNLGKYLTQFFIYIHFPLSHEATGKIVFVFMLLESVAGVEYHDSYYFCGHVLPALYLTILLYSTRPGLSSQPCLLTCYMDLR